MTTLSDPPIYHITHVDNLPSILQHGGLWCDAQRIERKIGNVNIGHLHIKKRRLARQVATRAGGMLGDYVPFNFCPRSVMLYVIHRGHQDYSGGQDGIIHLVSSVSRAVALGRAWAFTDRHAELGHASHFDNLDKLGEVPWSVMQLPYWSHVKEERQSEFLVQEFFPWTEITEIATMTSAVAAKAQQALQVATFQPTVAIRREWYY